MAAELDKALISVPRLGRPDWATMLGLLCSFRLLDCRVGQSGRESAGTTSPRLGLFLMGQDSKHSSTWSTFISLSRNAYALPPHAKAGMRHLRAFKGALWKSSTVGVFFGQRMGLGLLGSNYSFLSMVVTNNILYGGESNMVANHMANLAYQSDLGLHKY
ncbi:hypothetical protein CR513_56781, partial [Mucuna pruriens]